MRRFPPLWMIEEEQQRVLQTRRTGWRVNFAKLPELLGRKD
jgi:hypothetical protein